MQIPAPAAWAWIPIVVGAALAQTARNAAQRTVSGTLGAWPATLVRFLYGIPFALAWLVAVYLLDPAAGGMPSFGGPYWGWLTLGAAAQIMATWLLLSAMAQRNFIIGVTLSRSDVLQVAVFSMVFLAEVPTWATAAAVIAGTAGVILFSLPPRAAIASAAAWFNPAALLGLASGSCFALANVGYRGAALELHGLSPWVIGAWNVLLAQILQTIALVIWLERRQPGTLRAVAGAWRISLVAGAFGAIASVGWGTAVALRPAADVRIVGLTEVFFSYLVSRRLFQEHVRWNELVGMILIVGGVVLVCL